MIILFGQTILNYKLIGFTITAFPAEYRLERFAMTFSSDEDS